MKIQLREGFFAEIDDEDFHLISGHKWGLKRDDSGKTFYATALDHKIRMHRLIIGAKPGERVDHRDLNGLNNRRSNLRIATQSQNMANTGLQRSNTSGYKGVFWSKKDRRWRVELTVMGVRRRLGYFRNIEDAARAYDSEAIKAWGEFARPNFPKNPQGILQNSLTLA